MRYLFSLIYAFSFLPTYVAAQGAGEAFVNSFNRARPINVRVQNGESKGLITKLINRKKTEKIKEFIKTCNRRDLELIDPDEAMRIITTQNIKCGG